MFAIAGRWIQNPKWQHSVYTNSYQWLQLKVAQLIIKVYVKSSVRNWSAIIAHYGLSNAKPLILDLILVATRDKLSIKKTPHSQVKEQIK